MRYFVLYLISLIAFFARSQSPFNGFRANLQADNFEAALHTLDSCTFAKYQQDSCLYYRGLLTLKKGNLRGARAICSSLEKTYPAFSEAHYLSALIYFVSEDYGKSVDEFNRILKNDSSHLKALYNRSLAFGMLEDYTSAIEGLDKCIVLNPTNAMAYYSRAYWYEFSSKYTEAKKDYEESIRLDPKNYDAYMGLAYIYQNQKENEKACEVINKAIAAGSQIAEELKDGFCKQQGQ